MKQHILTALNAPWDISAIEPLLNKKWEEVLVS